MSLARIDMASGHRTERLNMIHMDDKINMVMFTIEATSSHVMIGVGVVDLDHVSLNNLRERDPLTLEELLQRDGDEFGPLIPHPTKLV